MKRLLLLSVCAMLLALPAASALCASCVSGPCTASGNAAAAHAAVQKAAKEPAVEIGEELPPCHAAMAAAATPAKPATPATPADSPCHEQEQDKSTTAGLSCCSTGEVPPATQAISLGDGSRDGQRDWLPVFAGQSISPAEQTQRLFILPSTRGEPLALRSTVALHVLQAVWLI